MKRLLIAFSVLFAVSTGAAGAAEETFSSPTFGGERLDWCHTFQHGCGQQAANAFCVSQKFQSASDFKKQENVGLTRTIGDSSVCEEKNCDSFAEITCFTSDMFGAISDALLKIFPDPMFNGTRLDWCYGWGTSCGQPAADAFCKSKDRPGVAQFEKAPGLPKTRVISTGQVCSGGQCDGFDSIVCD